MSFTFVDFKKAFQSHVAKMLEDQTVLYVTDVSRDDLWDMYLESFPEGTNNIFRERREFDCSCCRHFIKSFGNVVAIKNNKLVSIWDFKINDSMYNTVIKALSKLVKSQLVKDVFVTKEALFGTDKNYEKSDHANWELPLGTKYLDGDGRTIAQIITWKHFQIKLPERFVTKSSDTEASLMGVLRSTKNVFRRSLDEISEHSIETVLELIAQKSLYKGDEWKAVLKKFLVVHKEYQDKCDMRSEQVKDIFCWSKSIEVGGVLSKIRNHSIGVLLTDITNEVDLNEAVRKYESIVAPTNYKRPKAIFTKKMIEQAKEKLTELGLIDSLGRRHAFIDDITINNVLFANKDSIEKMSGNVFDELEQEVSINPKKFDKVEEVSVETFVKEVLPVSKSIELLFENKHISNLVSVIAPKVRMNKPLFKWDNEFSWAYNGNITDSMKERVKAAGGNVSGVLRLTNQWNESFDNRNDFDAHCIEPDGNHIWYQNKGLRHPSTGMLDVDIIHPERDEVAVENITWTDINRMREGLYIFFIKNYSHRGGRSGFTAEIEYDGQIYSYEYNKELRQDENVTVAELEFSRANGIKFIKSLPSTTSTKTIWNIPTNQFHPVSVCMFSPNYWDKQTGIGNKHYFFILDACRNDDQPNGFFNEFLREDLMSHKRVFEALGSKMRVEQADRQLSGLGFSSTKRNSLICKVSGHVNRMIKVVF